MNERNAIRLEILKQLLLLTDRQWGDYALRRDPLYPRMRTEERAEAIAYAQNAGVKAAERLSSEGSCAAPESLLEDCGVQIVGAARNDGCGLYFLAQFQEPDRIVLYEENIGAVSVYEKLLPAEKPIVRRLVLAHELYHVLELKRPELTAAELRVPVFKFGSYIRRKTLRAVSEIAAMSFAKELTGTQIHPQLLDILLLYAREDPNAENTALQLLERLRDKER